MSDEVTQPGAGAPEPVAPVVPEPPVVEPPTPAPEDAADEANDKEWEDAEKEVFPGLKTSKKKDDSNEQAKPTEEPKTPEAPKTGEEGEQPPVAGTPPAAPAAEAPKAGEAEAEPEAQPPETTARDTRLANREVAAQLDAIRSDVKTSMFSELPDTLQDADGDPINGIDDVMKLINPQTGEAFTQDEAGAWLLSAQQNFNKSRDEIEKQIDQIAETNLDLKEEADIINHEFGELLRSKPELRDEIWAEFQATLVKDEASDIVTKMPVSLEKYYRGRLKPYVEQPTTTPKPAEDAAAVAAAEAKAAEDAAAAKKAEEEAKKKRRSDRSDVFGNGPTDTLDDEDKEWEDAKQKVFGNK